MNEWVTKLTEPAGRRESKGGKGQGNKDHLNINTNVVCKSCPQRFRSTNCLGWIEKSDDTEYFFNITEKRGDDFY